MRTWGPAVALALLVALGGGGAGTAAVVLVAALLAVLGERWFGHRPRPAAGTAGPAASAAAAVSFDGADEPTRTLLEALGEGIVIVAADGRIVFANPAARALLRRPTQSPVGQPLWEALMPDLASMAREAWRAVIDGAPRGADELPHVRYSGLSCRDRVYDLTAVDAVSPRTGQHFGALLLFVDSTRGYELQRLKDRFLSSVSHELRTPLTNICAYTEILRTLLPGESAEWPEFVRVIHEEGLHLSRLVDAMFDFLQLESGEAVFALEDVDGAEVVRDVVRAHAVAAVSRRIDLQFVEGEAVPSLVADRARLRQVARALIDNALKFTPSGGQVNVTVAGREESWELRVEDSGPGVPPRDRSAVFDKFHQLPDHLTDKPTGTGLGLATARAVVARLGGLIWCEDAALGGACFVVRLPGSGQPRLAVLAAGTGAGGGF
ncbi:MAG: PAS domain-containing sensor histidine kinase [Planctomycetes bacterium]|nr:PAS domain-containing sensor histidine kinase [Planctomycetota bacterium]